MGDYFEIFGTLIKYDEIKDFRILQKEYIYRPTYKEEEKGLFKNRKYVFAGMKPYAAIIDEKGHKTALSKQKARDIKEAVGIDVLGDIRTTIGDKFNIKAIRAKQYICQNQTGRIFQTYLEDIPALVGRLDGKFSDVMKNDELYSLLGEPIAPAINIIPALVILAKEEYVFYGNGIQIMDVEAEFQRLKMEMDAYNQEKKNTKKGLFGIIQKGTSNVQLPGKKQATLEDKESSGDIAKLKKALADGIITQEEYDAKLAKIIDSI